MSKTILLTGATDGIGRVTADKLVDLGHTVLVHGRSQDKVDNLVSSFSKKGGNAVTGYCADLSDLNQVQAFAQAVARDFDSIDILLNNAGIYNTPDSILSSGLDVRFVVNSLAPYFLTKCLLPLMTREGRVVNVSSAAQSSIDLAALMGQVQLTDDFQAYAQSKLAMIMWSIFFAETLGDNAPSFIAVNPGSLLASKMVREGFGIQGNDINIGANILVEASLSERFNHCSGKYFDNDKGEFSSPHHYALDSRNRESLIDAQESLLKLINNTRSI